MSNSETADDSASSTEDTPESQTRRKTLIESVTALISVVIVGIPAVLGSIFYLDPVLKGRKRKAGGGGNDLDGLIKLDVNADSVPEDGLPVAVTVKSDLKDAWNLFKDVPIGSIWLRKNPDGSILVFNSICPHLGCSVNYRRSDNDFYCPCHTSSFSLDGKKKNEVPPRDMDTLELVRATDGAVDPKGQELWIKFQNFRGAQAEKTPV